MSEPSETPRKPRRRGKPRPERYKPPGTQRRQKLADDVAAEVTELVEAPAPKPRRPKPRHYAPCSYCGRNVGVSASFRGITYCAAHRDPAKRPKVATEADVIKRMQSSGISGTRTASTTSRRKRHRDRFDASENNYL